MYFICNSNLDIYQVLGYTLYGFLRAAQSPLDLLFKPSGCWYLFYQLPFNYFPLKILDYLWICTLSLDILDQSRLLTHSLNVTYLVPAYFQVLCICAKSLRLCLTLCDTMACSLPGSYVHGSSRQENWSGLSCPPPGIFLTQELNPHSWNLIFPLVLLGKSQFQVLSIQ